MSSSSKKKVNTNSKLRSFGVLPCTACNNSTKEDKKLKCKICKGKGYVPKP